MGKYAIKYIDTESNTLKIFGVVPRIIVVKLPYQPSMVQARDYVPTERCKILSVNPK